eukprot:7642516-Pyramimonas_sp.AAC.1
MAHDHSYRLGVLFPKLSLHYDVHHALHARTPPALPARRGRRGRGRGGGSDRAPAMRGGAPAEPRGRHLR